MTGKPEDATSANEGNKKPEVPVDEVLREVRVSLEKMIQQLAALVTRLEQLGAK